MLLQQLEDKVRKARVEVTWKDAVAERTLVIERFVTALGEDRTDAAQEQQTDQEIIQDAIKDKAVDDVANQLGGGKGPL